MEKREFILSHKRVVMALRIVAGVLFLSGLYLSSLYNYLLFHGIAEIFSIAISVAFFMIAWNSRRQVDNHYLLLLGIAFFFTGCIDLVHTLAYKGMNIFAGYDSNLPTQLWIMARYIQGISLLVAPLFIKRRLKGVPAFSIYFVISVLLLLSVFYWNNFPVCYVEGAGLTPFKIYSEYVISAFMIGSIVLLYRQRKEFDSFVLYLLIVSIVLTVFAELCFTLYISVYGFANLLGHIFKVVAVWLLYRALVQTGIARPFDTIFRNLKLSEARFHEMFDNARSGVAIYQARDDGADFIIKDFNKAAEKIDRIKKGDIIGRSVLEVFPGVKEFGLFQLFQRVWQTGNPEHYPVRRYHDDRIAGWRDNYVYKLPSGEIVAVYADITEQKVTEEELNLKAYLLDNATDSILLHDLAGNIIFANATACSSLGYTREEMVGLNLLKTIPEEEAKLWDSRIKERLEQGPIIFETNLRRKDGSIRNAEVHTRIIDVNGRKMVFSVSRDISERQKMEKSLLIADRLSALGEMALGFSHELNNPLTAVVGYSQLILDDKSLPEKMRTDIGHIHSQAQRAANIIRNFMLFAQKRPAIKQPTELNNVITNVLNLREFQLKNERIEVVLKLSSGLAAVMADASQLQQVFLDIVMNAEYFMLKAHNKGTLTITTEMDGGMVRACFADDGEGIARENLTRIFNPFFTTKEVGQGTGLGLAISHSIISEHGGRIYAESEPGQGATIIVELPVARI